MGLSLREVEAVLDWLGVDCCYQAIWYWKEMLVDAQGDLPTTSPSQVAIDKTDVRINGDWTWVYSAIYLHSQLIHDVEVSGRSGTDPAATFLHRLTEKHDLSDTVFLVDCYGYLTAHTRVGLSSQLDYTDRNQIDKWFHILKMRVDYFHDSWVGSRTIARNYLA